VTARKVCCTLAVGPYAELLEVARPALEDYAARHGYDLVIADRTLAADRALSWSKVRLLHDLVQRYETAFWIDGDAIIVDGSVDIADALDPRAFLGVVEHSLPAGRVPNCGVMVLRGGSRARRFLERVWRKTEYIQHEWWENAAVLDLLGYRVRTPVRPARPSPWRLGVSFLDTAWNSIPDDPAAAPRIVHLPGLPLETRRARMRELADTTLSTVAAGGDEWTKPPRP
jgi:hypothetical protein